MLVYLFDLSRINDENNIIDGDTRLSYVSRKNLKWKTDQLQSSFISTFPSNIILGYIKWKKILLSDGTNQNEMMLKLPNFIKESRQYWMKFPILLVHYYRSNMSHVSFGGFVLLWNKVLIQTFRSEGCTALYKVSMNTAYAIKQSTKWLSNGNNP